MSTYVYDAGWERELERLRGLEAAADPATVRAFDTIGVEAGWRCLEVGAGGGSIVELLRDRVRPTGRVVAVDLDTRFIQALEADDVEVHAVDITTDPVPEGPYDLVHARAVLEHLPDRDEVLGRLAGLLAAGGWLVIEDVDFLLPVQADPQHIASPSPERARRQATMWAALGSFMRDNGIDPEYGRRLPMRLVELGLEEVQASSTAHVLSPHSPAMPTARWSLEHFRAPLVAQGMLDDADVDALLADLDRPASGWGPLMVTAWGRLPPPADRFSMAGPGPGQREV